MYLSAAEARGRLRVSRDTLSKLIKSGELKASKIGHSRNSPYRIAEADLAEYMERQAAVGRARWNPGGQPPAKTGLLSRLGRNGQGKRAASPAEPSRPGTA